MKIRQAVILAGGLGTRLLPLTLTRPKPMVELHGKPFLTYLIALLRENGISEIVLLLGYLSNVITEYYKDGKEFGVRIKYSIGSVDENTGTRIKNAKAFLNEHFLLLYCDNYWPLDLVELESFYNKKKKLASVVVYSNLEKRTINNMFVDREGIVQIYDPTRQNRDLNGVEIGFFVLSSRIFDYFPENDFSFEKDILHKLISQKELVGFMSDKPYISIGSIDRLPQAKQALLRNI